MLCRHSQQAAKVDKQIEVLEKELEAKNHKKGMLTSLLESFKNEGHIEYLQREI
jgi:hypothetical protein